MLKWFFILSTLIIGLALILANVMSGTKSINIIMALPIAVGTFACIKLIMSNYSSDDEYIKKARNAIWLGVIFLMLSAVPLVLSIQTLIEGYTPIGLSTREGKFFISALNTIYMHYGAIGVSAVYLSIFLFISIFSALVIRKGRKHLTIGSRWTK